MAISEMINLPPIQCYGDLIRTVREYGFLPFFSDPIPGYSIDDAVPLEVWATNQGLGPWMRRDEIAHLANYRRDGYDDGLARYEDKRIYDLILQNGGPRVFQMHTGAPAPSASCRREEGHPENGTMTHKGVKP